VKWICKVCGYETSTEPKETWDTCPNCDNFKWMKDGERNDIKWTTEPPTEPGLYRAVHKDKTVGWVMVGKRHGWVLKFGDDGISKKEDFTHWLGPLPVPEPPHPLQDKEYSV
jgi:hypothetical protein